MRLIMLILNAIITIQTASGMLYIDSVNSVVIQQSLKDDVDRATIKLAKNILVNQADLSKKPINEVIASGDKVVIQLGYNISLTTRFVGYVARVNPKVPLEIECEDQMWVYKRQTVKPKVFNGGTIKQVIDYVAPGVTSKVLDTQLGGQFIISSDEPTVAMVFKKIKEVYGLSSTFVLDGSNPVLLVGKQYLNAAGTEPIKYRLNQNVITNNLELVKAADVRIKVEVSSRQSDGKILKNEFKGDDNGSVVTLVVPGLSQSEVEHSAKELYQKSKVDRFDGSITTFGIPVAYVGYVAQIDTSEYEVKQTSNYIEELEISFSKEGYRQVIKLGENAA